MNFDWKSFCNKITNSIWSATKPIVGTPEAAIKMKQYKKSTKKIDVLAEDVVIEYLKRENMDVTLLSEEVGELQIGANSKYIIILDPIDGTTNSVRNLPFFSTSIAVAKGKTFENIIFGYVRNYLTNEIFIVDHNRTYYNNKKCSSSACTSLNKALISLYSYSKVDYNRLIRLIKKIGKMRLLGAISIELMYVGSNILDGLIDLRGDLLITDIAAGIPFLKQAGGIVTNSEEEEFKGKFDIDGRYSLIAAGNKVLHEQFLKILRE